MKTAAWDGKRDYSFGERNVSRVSRDILKKHFSKLFVCFLNHKPLKKKKKMF